MNALVAFGAALLALRLAGLLARRWRATRRPELAAWAWALAAYAVAAAAIAWGEAAQWDGARLPRLLRERRAPDGAAPRRRLARCSQASAARPRSACSTPGLAIGVALAMPVHGVFARARTPARAGSPRASCRRGCSRSSRTRSERSRSSWSPLRSLRRRPLGNTLIVLGVAAAAIGSGVAGLGAGGAALGIAVGAVLLYAGFTCPLGGRDRHREALLGDGAVPADRAHDQPCGPGVSPLVSQSYAYGAAVAVAAHEPVDDELDPVDAAARLDEPVLHARHGLPVGERVRDDLRRLERAVRDLHLDARADDPPVARATGEREDVHSVLRATRVPLEEVRRRGVVVDLLSRRGRAARAPAARR